VETLGHAGFTPMSISPLARRLDVAGPQ